MLDYLKDKKDVGFFLSVQALMQTCRCVRKSHFLSFTSLWCLGCLHPKYCDRVVESDGLHVVKTDVVFDVDSVLDLNAFERQNKAEGLGMVSEEGTSECGLRLPTVTSEHTVIQTSASTQPQKRSSSSSCFIFLWFANVIEFCL